MRILKHLLEQPFVFATGAAALIHSTWALGTFFSGEQPEGWHLIGWIVPALLIAFALDVGQIATSHEIRTHGLNFARGVTFMVFALATYYLQWLYMAHHMPALELSPGISAGMSGMALSLRDMAIWVIPSLLPLSTLLYTFSTPSNTVTLPSASLVVIDSEPDATFYELPEMPLLEFDGDYKTDEILNAFLTRERANVLDEAANTKITRKSKKPIEIESYESN